MSRSLSTLSFVAAAAVAAEAFAAPYFSTDFTSDTVGAKPTSITIVNPSGSNVGDGSVDGDVGVTTVSTSAIGGGNAMRMYDKSTSSVQARGTLSTPTQTGIFSFNFTAGPNIVENNGNSWIRISLGTTSVDASSTSTNVFQRVVINSTPSGANGSLIASNVSTGNLNDVGIGNFVQNSSNLLEIVFNRSGTSLSYTKGTSQTAAAGTYDVWLNGTLVADNYLMRSGTGDIQAITFGSGGTDQKHADWIFDNINVSPVPEPTSLAAIAIGSTALLPRRRVR